ncbi:hypothetical protein D018_0790A, partial [Vibrio parahaemolyticus VP2007-007]
MVSSEK